MSNSENIEKFFRINPYRSYNFFFNSSQNRRGVGILIANNVKFREIERVADPDENFLLMRIEIAGNEIIIGAVYGPNQTDKNFFMRLRDGLKKLGDFPICLGGDWNATPSIDKVESNIDCLNMASLPNLVNSKEILNLCRHAKLVEPYWILSPLRREYSYVPRAHGKINRSRIDFFLVLECLLNSITDCTIEPALQSRLFDHKAICFTTAKKASAKNKRPTIGNQILDDPDIEIVVSTAVAEVTICI